MSKPNIIWIYCDELRIDALSCYGNQYAEIHTPHIDENARQGGRDLFGQEAPPEAILPTIGYGFASSRASLHEGLEEYEPTE